MRFLSILVAMCVCFVLQPVAAQDIDENVAMFVDEYIRRVPFMVEDQNVTGVAIALIRNNELVWSQGFGSADLEGGIQVTADTPFSVESIGKALTAWEIMRLVEAGTLNLDAPANQYLTRWQIEGSGRNKPEDATIRRILSHTAGLTVDGYPGFTVDDPLPTLEEFLDGANGGQQVRILTPPGGRFSYSGGGYTVLQLLIEEVTGEPFAEVMQRDVLDLLGMTHSSFEWSPELGAATAYTRDGDVEDRVVHLDLAAGGLYTSANDLARFFTEGMTGDWLTPESVALMHTAADGTRGEYGFGNFLFTLADGTPVVWHDGIGFGVRSIFLLLPESGDGLIILTNKGDGNKIFRDIVCLWDYWLHGEQTRLCKSY
jgi:CubicO group peptidase (beta-lactamase class C family)